MTVTLALSLLTVRTEILPLPFSASSGLPSSPNAERAGLWGNPPANDKWFQRLRHWRQRIPIEGDAMLDVRQDPRKDVRGCYLAT
jgi:hypothetical protein